MRLFCNQSVLCDGELCTGVVANQAATVKSESQLGGPATGVDASEALGRPCSFEQQTVQCACLGPIAAAIAQVAFVGNHDAVVQAGEWVAAKAQMVRLETCANKAQISCALVKRAYVERVANGHAPMLPARVQPVVVVVVTTAHLVGNFGCMVVVDGATLVGGLDVFVHEFSKYGILGKCASSPHMPSRQP